MFLLLERPFYCEAYSNAIVLHIPKRIRQVILSNVADAMREPAICLDLPYPSSFHFINYCTTMEGATDEMAKPRQKPTSIGMLKRPIEIKA
jgi:hypothetical protein